MCGTRCNIGYIDSMRVLLCVCCVCCVCCVDGVYCPVWLPLCFSFSLSSCVVYVCLSVPGLYVVSCVLVSPCSVGYIQAARGVWYVHRGSHLMSPCLRSSLVTPSGPLGCLCLHTRPTVSSSHTDYAKRISKGYGQAMGVTNSALQQLTGAPVSFSQCPDANISVCTATSGGGALVLVAYNPLGRPVSVPLRVPISKALALASLVVLPAANTSTALPSQVVPSDAYDVGACMHLSLHPRALVRHHGSRSPYLLYSDLCVRFVGQEGGGREAGMSGILMRASCVCGRRSACVRMSICMCTADTLVCVCAPVCAPVCAHVCSRVCSRVSVCVPVCVVSVCVSFLCVLFVCPLCVVSVCVCAFLRVSFVCGERA